MTGILAWAWISHLCKISLLMRFSLPKKSPLKGCKTGGSREICVCDESVKMTWALMGLWCGIVWGGDVACGGAVACGGLVV